MTGVGDWGKPPHARLLFGLASVPENKCSDAPHGPARFACGSSADATRIDAVWEIGVRRKNFGDFL